MRNILFAFSLLSFGVSSGQIVSYPDAEIQRGYFDCPYQRYEAEPGLCAGNALFLMPPEPYTQTALQSEASNLTAAQLVSPGDYIEWECEEDADAMSLRFSLPDNESGEGIKGSLTFMINEETVTEVELDSFWAWQYFNLSNSLSKNPDNTPSVNKFARMKFDETYVKLPCEIKAGDKFRFVKNNDDNIVYTIDFVELEKAEAPVEFESLEGDVVKYKGRGATLQDFINANGGKTIYIPAGKYDIPEQLKINDDNTRLIGAGMWYTTLNFTQQTWDSRTAWKRGIESYASGIVIEGMTLSTCSNMRYVDNNVGVGSGKAFQGSFGKNSVIRNVRADHFECGAWIYDNSFTPSEGLRIENSRFRNNYADGVNLCSGTKGAVVTHCSFRNNGDDDMASWSRGIMTADNEFSYCTAENNWRASSLGFFGGENNKAHHIVIIDAMEGGARINADFEGTGFSPLGEIEIYETSIYSSGCIRGNVGNNGDLWGNSQPAILVQPGPLYEIHNVSIHDIDIFDSRFQAITLRGNEGIRLNNLQLHNIKINGTPSIEWDIFMTDNLIGQGNYSRLEFDREPEDAMSKIPVGFNFTYYDSHVGITTNDKLTLIADKGQVTFKNLSAGERIKILNIDGTTAAEFTVQSSEKTVSLPKGLYMATSGNGYFAKFFIR